MEGETTNQPPQMPTTQMKQPTQMPISPTGSAFGQHDHESPKHLGIVLGILVVVLVAVAGGLYLWWSGVFDVTTDEPEAGEASVVVPPEATDEGYNPPPPDLSGLSSSDEVGAILEDLGKVDIDSIEADLGSIKLDIDKLTEPNSEIPETPEIP